MKPDRMSSIRLHVSLRSRTLQMQGRHDGVIEGREHKCERKRKGCNDASPKNVTQTAKKHVLNMDLDNILMHKVFDELFVCKRCSCSGVRRQRNSIFNWNANNDVTMVKMNLPNASHGNWTCDVCVCGVCVVLHRVVTPHGIGMTVHTSSTRYFTCFMYDGRATMSPSHTHTRHIYAHDANAVTHTQTHTFATIAAHEQQQKTCIVTSLHMFMFMPDGIRSLLFFLFFFYCYLICISSTFWWHNINHR